VLHTTPRLTWLHCSQQRLAKGKIVEHWDTIEKVAPRSDWKNDNGKF
jgi:predicted SnoaL-like aldol condensation-catalyzing enzyme